MNILLIGPRKNIKHPEKIGGVIILFENLLEYCDEHHIKYNVIDTNKENYTNKIVSFLSILSQSISRIQKSSHISLHGTANDYLYIAPFVLFLSQILKKPFSIRKFAGNYIEIYESYSGLKKKIILYLLKNVSYSFFETKYLVKYFKVHNANTFWFPNVREKQNVFVDKKYNKKFVFIGLVTKEKGIDVLCEVSKHLDDSYTVDIFGPLSKDYSMEYFDNYNVSYKGVIEHENIYKVLLEYDVLVLPSFREGYPGIIIEALSIGMPIVATNLCGISEMLTNDSGILVKVNSVESLHEAMMSITESQYKAYSNNALLEFNYYDSSIQTAKFFNMIGVV